MPIRLRVEARVRVTVRFRARATRLDNTHPLRTNVMFMIFNEVVQREFTPPIGMQEVT